MSNRNENGGRSMHPRIVLALAIIILTFSMYGFGDKFVQFVLVARGESEGIFALTPIINYLLASFGFLCLLGWAATKGMFYDIERPKFTLLETENQLDKGDPHNTELFTRSVL